jgi:hypothetical protein
MGPLSGDITSLYARLLSNQTQFKNTAQLVRDVIAREEDTRIWATVYDLIAHTKSIFHPTIPPRSSISFAASF